MSNSLTRKCLRMALRSCGLVRMKYKKLRKEGPFKSIPNATKQHLAPNTSTSSTP